jgi:hypothetical protein
LSAKMPKDPVGHCMDANTSSRDYAAATAEDCFAISAIRQLCGASAKEHDANESLIALARLLGRQAATAAICASIQLARESAPELLKSTTCAVPPNSVADDR